MGKRAISRRAWQRATNALLCYPENLREYASLVEELMTKKPKEEGKPIHKDPTADKAIVLYEDKRFRRIQDEIEAVEEALSHLRPGEEIIIRRRYWELPRHRSNSPRQYDFLQDLPYSYRTMQRVVRRTIFLVAKMLGE